MMPPTGVAVHIRVTVHIQMAVNLFLGVIGFCLITVLLSYYPFALCFQLMTVYCNVLVT